MSDYDGDVLPVTRFHLHKWMPWRYDHLLKIYEDGEFAKSMSVYMKFCAVCGKPRVRKVSR